MLLYRPALWVSLTALIGACGAPDAGGDLDAGLETDGGPSYPAPNTDLVPQVGSDATLDLATWNIENFPRNPTTAITIADLVASMDLDIVAVQEMEDIAAFEEVVARLPDHDGVLSTHTYSNGSYQKVGFIFKRDLVSVGEPELLFTNMGYEFPRPPMQVVATVDDGVHPPLDLVIVTLHLKAGRDFEDRERREAAMIALADHLETTAAAIDPDIVALGDFNEVVTSTEGRAIFDPFLAEPSTYTLETDELATDGKFTFLPSRAILDHVLATGSPAAGTAVIPPLHTQMANYESAISDHLPVVLSVDL